MTIKVIVHEEDGGYWAEVPEMPGCVTEGDTLDDLVKYLWEAIEGWTESSVQFDAEAYVAARAQDSLELLLPALAA